MITADEIVEAILEREGDKFTNHPADRGGPTRHGVTMPALAEYRGRPVTEDDIRTLTRNEAREVFRVLYVERPGFGGIVAASVRGLVVDCGVLHGRARASKWLQTVLGVKVDGHVGPVTLRALNTSDPRRIYCELLCMRQRQIADLVQHRPDQLVWLEGWINRCNEFWRDVVYR